MSNCAAPSNRPERASSFSTHRTPSLLNTAAQPPGVPSRPATCTISGSLAPSPESTSDDGKYGRYWRCSQAGCRFHSARRARGVRDGRRAVNPSSPVRTRAAREARSPPQGAFLMRGPTGFRTFGLCLREQNGIAAPRYSLTEALESEETTGVWFERERVYGCPRRTSVARTALRPGGRAAPGLEFSEGPGLAGPQSRREGSINVHQT